MAGGLFGYLAAGVAEGVGTSIVDQARAKREAALEELRTQREMAFRRGEREAGEAFSSRENALTREASADIVTLDDGTSATRSGSTVKPLTDSAGKSVRVMGDKSESPADVKTAEWLIRQGVAKDADDAWRRVSSAKTNDNARAKLVLDTYKILKEDFSDQRTDQEKRQEAQRMVDELISDEDGSEPPSTMPDAMERPKGMTDEQIIEEAKAALAKKAPAAAVRSRLIKMGIDPAAAGL